VLYYEKVKFSQAEINIKTHSILREMGFLFIEVLRHYLSTTLLLSLSEISNLMVIPIICIDGFE